MPFPPIETPFRLHEDTVHPDWIDGNGHMNAWQYNNAFSKPMRKFFSIMGLGLEFREGAGQGIFLLDCRIQYLDEVLEGMRLVFETRLIDHSDKVVHYFTQMLAGGELYPAATCEAVEVQVDLTTRRSSSFSPEVMDYLRPIWAPIPSCHCQRVWVHRWVSGAEGEARLGSVCEAKLRTGEAGNSHPWRV